MQVVGDAADGFFLLDCGVDEPETVLKAMAVPHFSVEFQRFRSAGQLQLQFHNVTNVNIARNCGAQAAFSNVLGSSVQRLFCPDDQPLVQKVA